VHELLALVRDVAELGEEGVLVESHGMSHQVDLSDEGARRARRHEHTSNEGRSGVESRERMRDLTRRVIHVPKEELPVNKAVRRREKKRHRKPDG
jgi:hypothetical protein